MKDYYVRFGRKFAIPPTIQIKNEIRRMTLDERRAAPADPQPAPVGLPKEG